MVSGRKPKPAALRMLQGNSGKRRINRRQPVAPMLALEAPAELTPLAAEEWNRIVPLYHATGLLTELDRSLLIAFCEAHASFMFANAKIKEYGPVMKTTTKRVVAPDGTVTESGGNLIQSPYLGIRSRAVVQMVQIASVFGFDPSSRNRLEVPGGITPPASRAPAADPMSPEGWLQRGIVRRGAG